MRSGTRCLKHSGCLGIIFLITAIFQAIPVQAVQPAPDGNQTLSYELAPVIVTAGKRPERLEDIPAAATVIPEQDIFYNDIDSTRSFDHMIPNMRTYGLGNRGGGGRTFNIRGMANTGGSGTRNAVTLYIDGVPYSDTYALDHVLTDIDRIEVLRGPQGTLYGMGAEAGVINIVSQKPGNEPSFHLGGKLESYNTHTGTFSLSGPLKEDLLAVSLSGYASGTDGFIKDDFDDGRIGSGTTISLKGAVRFTPTDDLDIMLRLGKELYEENGGYPAVPTDRSAYNAMWGTDLDRYENWEDADARNSIDGDSQSLTVDWDADLGTLTSITARTFRNSKLRDQDGDFTALDVFSADETIRDTTWTQELRFASRETERYQWLVGGFGSYNTYDYEAIYKYGAASPVPGARLNGPIVDRDQSSLALFGQGTYRLFEEKLGLTVGLRYEYATEGMDGEQYDSMGGVEIPGTRRSSDERMHSNEWLPKFAVDYRFMDELTGYVSAAKGYKPAGVRWNKLGLENYEYKSETAWTYELGFKWLNDQYRTRIELTGFFTDIDNYQDVIWLDPMTSVYDNAAKANIKGVELEIHSEPVRGLELTATFGLTDSDYDQYSTIDPVTGLTENYDGNSIAWAADYDFRLSARYRFENGIYLGAELEGVGPYYFNAANTEKQDAYQIVNAKAGYEHDHFDIFLYGKNLGDTLYYGYAFPSGQGYWMGIPGTPQTFGLEANLYF